MHVDAKGCATLAVTSASSSQMPRAAGKLEMLSKCCMQMLLDQHDDMADGC